MHGNIFCEVKKTYVHSCVLEEQHFLFCWSSNSSNLFLLGYIVESGVTRQPYGGHRITEALNASFTESKYRFFTDVEFPIVRLAMEKVKTSVKNGMSINAKR